VKAQKAALAKRGFDPSLVDTPKLTLLNADLAAGDLGIGELLLEELRTTVTHIIHAGWLINWSVDLTQFEPLIKGTRNLIDLALSSPLPTPPRIIFISSVAVLRGCEYLLPSVNIYFHLNLFAQLLKAANCVPRSLLDQSLLWVWLQRV
jgi:thioester reductase-like protein